MNNLSIKSTIAAGVLSLAMVGGHANAYSHKVKFYVGTGVDYNFYRLSSDLKEVLRANNADLTTDGFGLLVPMLGVKFNPHLGVEAGYSLNKRFKLSPPGTNNTVEARYRVRNMYMDLVGFMPLHKHVDLFGGVGISKLSVKAKDTIAATATNDLKALSDVSNKFGFKAKLGLNYHCHEHLGMRGGITYQNTRNSLVATNIKIFKDLVSVNLGLTYTF